MKLVDSNVWLALAHPKHEFYDAAAVWWAGLKRGEALFCRATELSFLRLLTNESISRSFGVPATSNEEAWLSYETFRADRRIGWANEPPGVDAVWKQFSTHKKPSPKLWMDAYLAAFAVAGKFQFVSIDFGFRQFKALDLQLLTIR